MTLRALNALLCVRGLVIAYIISICCQPSERDTGHRPLILGIDDILISWFIMTLALLGVALLGPNSYVV